MYPIQAVQNCLSANDTTTSPYYLSMNILSRNPFRAKIWCYLNTSYLWTYCRGTPFGQRSDAIYMRIIYEHTAEEPLSGKGLMLFTCVLSISRVKSPYIIVYMRHFYLYILRYITYIVGFLCHGVLAEHGTTSHSLWWLEALMGSGSMIDITDG